MLQAQFFPNLWQTFLFLIIVQNTHTIWILIEKSKKIDIKSHAR